MITIRYISGNSWVFRAFSDIQEAKKAICNYRKNKIFAEFVNW